MGAGASDAAPSCSVATSSCCELQQRAGVVHLALEQLPLVEQKALCPKQQCLAQVFTECAYMMLNHQHTLRSAEEAR